jgi:hypothetical protein
MKTRYIILIALLIFTNSIMKAQLRQSQGGGMQGYDQFLLTAIKDFSKTKLFKEDSVFHVNLHDTLYRVAADTISKNHYRSKRGKGYPDIVAVDILGFPRKYLLDTTIDLNNQKAIPSRFIEKNGKLFIWYDGRYPLMDSTIKMLDKYHLIVRGKELDWAKLIWGTDDSKQAADYYFCRNNSSDFKRKITRMAVGFYDPPHISCK